MRVALILSPRERDTEVQGGYILPRVITQKQEFESQMSDFSAYLLLYMPSLTECQDFPEKKKSRGHEMRGENELGIQQLGLPGLSVNGRDAAGG